jgi:hypothetical protein
MGFSVFSFFLSAAYQYHQMRSQKKRQERAQKEANARADAAKGIILPVEGSPDNLLIPFGRNLIGGVRVYHNTKNTFTVAAVNSGGKLFNSGLTNSISGEKHEFLFMQQVLSVAGLNDVLQVFIEGVLWNDKSISYGNRLHVYPKGNVVDSMAGANFPERLDAHFNEMAYASCVFRLNREEPQYGGVPQVQFFVEGLCVRDIIKTGETYSLSSLESYSVNPALCLLHYLINPVYGRGLNVSKIHLKSFYEAKLVCDQMIYSSVAKEGTFWAAKPVESVRSIKAFECHTVLSTGNPLRDNIELILETMGPAELIWTGGQYQLNFKLPLVHDDLLTYPIDTLVQAEPFTNDFRIYKSLINSNGNPVTDAVSWEDVTIIITDDDIHRGESLEITYPNAQQRLNNVTIRFKNEAQDFIEDTVSWPPKNNYIDGPNLNRGVWSAVTAYNKSDIVTFGASSYTLATGKARVFSSNPADDPAWIEINNNDVYRVFLAEDNYVPLEIDTFDSGSIDYYHALANAEQRVRISRANVIYKIRLMRTMIGIQPGDIVKLYSDVYNIPGELIRIEEVKANDAGEPEITAYKYDSRQNAWSAQDDEIVPPRNLYSDIIENATNLSYSPNTNTNNSAGRLSWSKSADGRVNQYIIKYTLTAIENITSTTQWIEVARTSNLFYDLPAIYSGNYTFTVVAYAPALNKQAPFYDVLSGSAWPFISVGIPITVINNTSYLNLRIYKRSLTEPDLPTGGSFNFTNLSFVSLPLDWFSSKPNGSDPLWVSYTVAKVPGGVGVDAALVWSEPELLVEGPYSIDLTKPSILIPEGIGSNDYSEAIGRIRVIYLGTEITETSDVTFSIIQEVNCSVNIINTNGVTKGIYTVTDLSADTGSFTIVAVFDTYTVYRLVTLTLLKASEAYIPDLTPPPTPSFVNVTVGFAVAFIQVGALDYSQGHGHAKTRIYSASPDQADLELQWADFESLFPTWWMNESYNSSYPGIREEKIADPFYDTSILAVNDPEGIALLLSRAGRTLIFNYSDAIFVSEFLGSRHSLAIQPAVVKQIWLSNVTIDGVESVVPYGPVVAWSSTAVPGVAVGLLTADNIVSSTLYVDSRINVGDSIYIDGKGFITHAKIELGDVSYQEYLVSHLESIRLEREEFGLTFNTATVNFNGQIQKYIYTPSASDELLIWRPVFTNALEGTAAANSIVTVPGLVQPPSGAFIEDVNYQVGSTKIILGISSMTTYDPNFKNQKQLLALSYDTVSFTPVASGYGTLSFIPRIKLTLDTNNNSEDLNDTLINTATDTWTSATHKTPANTTQITVTAAFLSKRGTGTGSNWRRRKVTWRIDYLQNGVWILGSTLLTDIGPNLEAYVSAQLTKVFPSPAAWSWRVFATAADVGGATPTFSLAGTIYTYKDELLYGSTSGTDYDIAKLAYYKEADAAPNTFNLLDMTLQLTTPTQTGEIYKITFEGTLEIGIVSEIGLTKFISVENLQIGCAAVAPNGWGYTINTGPTLYEVESQYTPVSRTYSYSYTLTGSSLTLNNLFIRSQKVDDGFNSLSAADSRQYVKMTTANIKARVYRRVAATNSTTAVNNFRLDQYSYSLSAAEILAEGTVRWTLIGESGTSIT